MDESIFGSTNEIGLIEVSDRDDCSPNTCANWTMMSSMPATVVWSSTPADQPDPMTVLDTGAV